MNVAIAGLDRYDLECLIKHSMIEPGSRGVRIGPRLPPDLATTGRPPVTIVRFRIRRGPKCSWERTQRGPNPIPTKRGASVFAFPATPASKGRAFLFSINLSWTCMRPSRRFLHTLSRRSRGILIRFFQPRAPADKPSQKDQFPE